MKIETKKSLRKFMFYVCIMAGAFYSGHSCDSFQKKTFTDSDKETPVSRLYELCLKSQMAGKQQGGNVLHCDPLMESITPEGKFKNFKSCFQFYQNNKKKLNNSYPGFNCFELFLKKDKKNVD
jgi:hypothetical protein